MPLTPAQKSAAHRTRVAERNRIRDAALREISASKRRPGIPDAYGCGYAAGWDEAAAIACAALDVVK